MRLPSAIAIAGLFLWCVVGLAHGQNPEAKTVYTVDCSSPSDHDQADLCEQQRQALAAEKSAFWAALQTGVGVVGFVAVLASLVASIAATRAATKTAQVAVEALKGSRAWVHFAGFETGRFYQGVIDGRHVDEGIFIRLRWTNAGSTPALQLDLYRHFELVPHGHPVPTFTRKPAPDVPTVATLGPGAQSSLPLIALSMAEYEEIATRQKDLYIYTNAIYRDVFNPDLLRHSECCGMLDHVGRGVGPDGQEMPQFSLQFVGEQNLAT